MEATFCTEDLSIADPDYLSGKSGVPKHVLQRIIDGKEWPCEDMAGRMANALGKDPAKWKETVRRREYAVTLREWTEDLLPVLRGAFLAKACPSAITGADADTVLDMLRGRQRISRSVLADVCRMSGQSMAEWEVLVPLAAVWELDNSS